MPNLSEVSDTLGWIYLKKNMSDNAMDIFQGLVNKMPGNSTYRFHLGMASRRRAINPRLWGSYKRRCAAALPRKKRTRSRI